MIQAVSLMFLFLSVGVLGQMDFQDVNVVSKGQTPRTSKTFQQTATKVFPNQQQQQFFQQSSLSDNPTSLVRMLTHAFVSTMIDSHTEIINFDENFISHHTKLRCEPSFSFSGRGTGEEEELFFTGHDQIKMFKHRFISTLRIQNVNYEIVSAEDSSGVALVKLLVDGIAKKTQTPFRNMEIWLMIEWNAPIAKIVHMDIVFKNLDKVQEIVWTHAEKMAHQLVWKIYSAQTMHQVQSVLSMVSPELVVTIDISPQWLIPRMQYSGQMGFLQYLKDFNDTISELPLRTLFNMMVEPEIKVILATHDTVVFRKEQAGDVFFIRMSFNVQGQLTVFDVTAAQPLQPWDVFPNPLRPGARAFEKFVHPLTDHLARAMCKENCGQYEMTMPIKSALVGASKMMGSKALKGATLQQGALQQGKLTSQLLEKEIEKEEVSIADQIASLIRRN